MTFEVQVTFAIVVDAEDANSAVDAAYKNIDSGEFVKGIQEGRYEPLDISWKDANEVTA